VRSRSGRQLLVAFGDPPFIGMIADDPMTPAVRQRIGAVVEMLRAGDMEAGARQFVETCGSRSAGLTADVISSRFFGPSDSGALCAAPRMKTRCYRCER
jgi:hypothetical protein